jgi:pyruvate dehydrogenase E2 component (dihydrolipoamide acetyltransferase)
MPKFGQMTRESTIVEWLKKEGDPVEKGDILFTVETDKSVMEVESFESGKLLKIIVPSGREVPVQSTVGFLGAPGESIPAVVAPPPPPAGARKNVAETASAAAVCSRNRDLPALAAQARPASAPLPEIPRRPPLSPRARTLVNDSGIDPADIRGTGPSGRIVEKDVQDFLRVRGYDKLRITPAAREKARREKLDLLAVAATAEGGRITMEDVDRALAERPRPLSRMRQVIAQRLAESVVTAPHFFVTVEVDVTELNELRTKLKQAGLPFTMTDFISRAVVATLKEFPEVNSVTDGKCVRWHSRVHLGLAVSLEQGLVVPVIRNADELGLAELHERAKALAEKARLGKLAPDEMTGSTFTISNLGMLDVENFTAIINPGESAILAVSSALSKPVVRGEQVVARTVMKMTLSSDHRLIDGAMAARFVNGIKAKLQNIELLKSWAA